MSGCLKRFAVALTCALVFLICLPRISLGQSPPPSRVASIICNATVTGKFTVDAVSLNFPLPSVAEGADCAPAISAILTAGLTDNFSSHRVAENRVEYTFTDYNQSVNSNCSGTSESTCHQPLDVAIVICNANLTGT